MTSWEKSNSLALHRRNKKLKPTGIASGNKISHTTKQLHIYNKNI